MRLAIILGIAIVVIAPRAGRADDKPVKPLVVAVSGNYPPSQIKNPDGTWSGTCVDAWKQVADHLGLTYTFREVDPAAVMAEGLDKLDIDVVAMCIGPNPRTEKMMDVTHPFYISGLAIATRPESSSGMSRIADKVLSLRFLRNLGLLLLIIVIVGVVVWRIEHRTSPDEFGGTPLAGIGGGIFWTVESLFAKPKPLSRRLRSRLVSLFWVIACMVLISGVTAKLAAEFTVTQLNGTVGGAKDLSHARVGAGIAKNGNHGTAARYLDAHGIPYRAFVGDNTQTDILSALDRGELDAMVGDWASLQYEATTHYPGRLLLLPETIQPTLWCFGLRPGSPLRKQIDTTIVKLVEAGVFKQIVAQYIGGAPT